MQQTTMPRGTGRIVLPEGKRCAACLTFDVDALALWLATFRFSSSTHAISRGEFEGRYGMQRMLDLLDKYGIKATFFTPGHTAQVFPDVIKDAHDRGHEIAAHGMYHAPYEVGLSVQGGPPPASPSEQRGYIEQQTEVLTSLTGEQPIGFRSPIGDWVGDAVPQALIDLGYLYDSSLGGSDFLPYRLRIGDRVQPEAPFGIEWGRETAIVEIPLLWDLGDFSHFEFLGYYHDPKNLWFNPVALHTPTEAFDTFSTSFDYCYDYVQGGIWNPILHPQSCGKSFKPLWLERLIQHIARREGVWWTTMREVAAAWVPDTELPDDLPAVSATGAR